MVLVSSGLYKLAVLVKNKQTQHTLLNFIQSEHSSYSYTYAEYAMPEDATVILDKWLEEKTKYFNVFIC